MAISNPRRCPVFISTYHTPTPIDVRLCTLACNNISADNIIFKKKQQPTGDSVNMCWIWREAELTNISSLFLSPTRIWSFKYMQLEADEIIAFRHFITLKQICDWLQGGIAAGSFCRHILMMQFLRWTSSTSVTPTMFQTLWVISKLIIYESFWRKLLGLSQERHFFKSPVLCCVFCLSHLILLVNKYIKLDV